MKKCNALAAIVGTFLLTGGAGSPAFGATIPFAEDFDDNSAPDFDFSSSSANVTAVVDSGMLTIDSTLGTGAQAMNALVDISNANSLPIVMEIDITPTVWLANGGHSAGFIAFSTNPAAGAFPSGPNSGYLADFVMSGSGAGYIRMIDFASGLTTITQSDAFPTGSLAVNETYHLTFTATPGLGGVLDLSLTIEDTTGTLIDEDGVVTIAGTTPAAASTGTFFGLRHRVGNNGTGANRTFDAVYDNFSMIENAPAHPGDFDGDVDGADFVVWQTNFPFTPSSGVAPVPEPRGFLLAGLAVLGLAMIATKHHRLATVLS
jgi:hypothetical protein